MTNKNEIGTLSQRSFRALLWNYFGSAVRMSSQFLIGIFLARLLGPEAFGIVAIGWLMVGIGNLVADFGLSAAVIQSEKLSENDIRFSFTAQVGFGASLTLAGYIFSDHIASFFHQPDATSTIRAMAFLFVLQSFGQTAGALLRRSLNFKVFQAISVSSYLIGYLGIGIPCAYYGLKEWSLVAAQLTQSFLFSIIAMWKVKHSWMPKLRPDSQNMFGFGGKVIGANLTSWLILNFDSFVIGRMLGVVNLGVYNRAMTLIGTPINTLTASLQGVLFSASSRAQADISQLRKGYYAATAVTALISLPLALTVAVVPDTIVLAIYGVQWLEVIPVLSALSLAMAIHALLAIVGPVLMAKNKVEFELRAQLITLLVMVPVLYLMAGISVRAVSWGVLGIYVIRWLLLSYFILTILEERWRDLFEVLLWPCICACVIALITFISDRLIVDTSPFIHLTADVVTAGVASILLIKLFGKKILQGAHGDYLMASGRLPKLIRRFID